MGFWSWLFGEPEKYSPPIDSRKFLSNGEEWTVPEEWFTDKDGERVRRKKKKDSCCAASSSEEGTVCCDVSDDVVIEILPVVALMSEAENTTRECKPQEFVDPDISQSVSENNTPCSNHSAATSNDHSTSHSNDYSSSSSYDSSSSSYDSSSSSYDSGGGGGGGGD